MSKMDKKRYEAGIALPMIMIVLLVLTILSAAAIEAFQNQSKVIEHIEEHESALQYAEMGYSKYLWQLNNDPYFYNRMTSQGSSIPLLCEVDTPYPSANNARGWYRLSVTPPDSEHQELTVRSTGWVAGQPNEARTIEVKLHRRQFTQFTHFTDNYGSLFWADGEILEGPMHTNNQFRIRGRVVFTGPVTYSGSPPYYFGFTPQSPPGTGTGAQFHQGLPKWVPPLVMPATNSTLKLWAQKLDLNGNPDGIYKEGRTRIFLHVNTMDISTFDINGVENMETNVALPGNGVLYVSARSPLVSKTEPFGRDLGNVFISGTLSGRLTVACSGDIFITALNPTLNIVDQTAFNNSAFPTYVDTADGITKSVGLKYQTTAPDADGDMLGLVAGRNIRVHQTNWPSSVDPYYTEIADVARPNIRIEAAMFATTGNYGVANIGNFPAGGNKGHTHVWGSVCQKTAAATWDGNTSVKNGIPQFKGYKEHNLHDSRMLINTPPHFIEADNAGWEVWEWREIRNQASSQNES